MLFTAMILYHHETSVKEVAVLYSMVVLIPCALQTLVTLRSLSAVSYTHLDVYKRQIRYSGRKLPGHRRTPARPHSCGGAPGRRK